MKSLFLLLVGIVTKWFILVRHSFSSNSKFSYSYMLRLAICKFMPEAPFFRDSLKNVSPISVFIPCAEKDLPLIRACIKGIEANVLNKVQNIYVITYCSELLQIELKGIDVTVVDESGLLSVRITDFITDNIPSSKQGWVKKQVLNMFFAYSSVEAGILSIDADTILLKPRIFLSNQVQLLFPVVEFEESYAVTNHKTWGRHGRSFGISFISHHMLFQPTIIRAMFDEIGGFEEATIKWLNSSVSDGWIPIGEFDSYATWLLSRNPRRVKFAKWGNLRLSRTLIPMNVIEKDDIYRYLKNEFPNYFSISLHHYLPENFLGNE